MSAKSEQKKETGQQQSDRIQTEVTDSKSVSVSEFEPIPEVGGTVPETKNTDEPEFQLKYQKTWESQFSWLQKVVGELN